MRLYQAADLQAAALAKHGSQQGLADKLRKNASAARKRAATKAAKPAPPPRYEEEDEGRSQGSNDLQCRCGETAAQECANGACCHCCRDMGGGCMRHGGY